MNGSGFFIENIVLAHKFNAPPHWFSAEYAKSRPRHGLVYVLEGGARYEYSDGEVLNVKKDDILYMPAGIPYLTRCGDEPFLHMTINFNIQGSIPLPRCRNCGENTRTKRDVTKLVEEWSHRQPFYTERCLGLLYLLICSQIKIVRESSMGPEEKLLSAMKLLGENFNQEISIPELAASCGVSEAYFRRLFARVYGMSPIAYLTNMRISYARELLSNTGFAVEYIGYECGYKDPAYFCRIFKKNTGLSPTAYRMLNGD